MKRSGPPKRKKGLDADPAKVREWQRRSRATLKASAGALRASTRLSKGTPRPKGERAGEGPLSPGEWRIEVWRADEGCCVGCGRQVPRDADLWVWQAHHVIPAQRLRAEGLLCVYDPRNGVTLCATCHRQHEAALPRIPGHKLPARVWAFARELGTWATDTVDRMHPSPPTPGGEA